MAHTLSRLVFFIRRPVVATLLAAGALLAPLSHAAAADREIYVVDMQRVIDESIVGKAARSNVEGDLRKREASLQKQKVELDSLKAGIDKQAALLSKEAKQEKMEQLEKRQQELQRAYSDQMEELERKRRSEIEKVVGQIRQVIQEIGEKEKKELIIEKDMRVVLFVGPKYDLTSEVIEKLNAKKLTL